MTNPGKISGRLEVMEFLKGYSMFTIVIFHFLQVLRIGPTFDKLISFGGSGVHLFVLLSGFGLYLSAKRKPLGYLAFLQKRFSKIYIPYILIVLLSALISLIIPIYYNSLYALLGHIFLFKMFDESIMGSYGYPLWFISLIIQLYFVFPLLAKLITRLTSGWFLAVCVGLSVVWITIIALTGAQDMRIWNSFFLQYIWEFGLGMLIADQWINRVHQVEEGKFRMPVFIVGIAATAIYGLLAIKGGSVGKLMNDLPALLGYTSIALFIYSLQLSIVNRFFTYIGGISFALYLLHFLFLNLGLYLLKELTSVYIAIVVITLVTFVSSIYYQQFISWFYKKTGI